MYGMLSSPIAPATQACRVLLRAVGLGVIAVVVSRALSPEPRKVLIYRSFGLALARCAGHVLPAAVSVFIVWINLTAYFIGTELEGAKNQDGLKLGLLQVAAKLQELLIIGSLATIVLHFLRLGLVQGNGIPLGHVSSAWSFTHLSYFWSTEFWGGFFTDETPRNRLRRIPFALLIIVSGAIAVLAGPATAVLMIPRVMDWPVGGAQFWLNGTADQLWPKVLNAAYMSDHNCSTNEAQLTDTRCPSAGYLPLYQHYSTWWHFPDHLALETEIQDYSLRKIIYSVSSDVSIADSWSYTTHAPSATLLDSLRGVYINCLYALVSRPQDSTLNHKALEGASLKRFQVDTKSPLVRASCMELDDLYILDSNPLLWFPFQAKYGHLWHHAENATHYHVPELARTLVSRGVMTTSDSHFSGLAMASSEKIPDVLAVPVVLPDNGLSELGLLLLRRTNDTEVWNAASCAVDARWATSQAVISSTKNNNLLKHEFDQDRVRNIVRSEIKTTNADQLSHASRWVAREDGTLQVIKLDVSWYDMLVPLLNCSNTATCRSSIPNPNPTTSSPPTTLESLISLILFPAHSDNSRSNFTTFPTMRAIENIISTIFADGISRSGSHLNRRISHLIEPNSSWNEFGNWHVPDEEFAKRLVRGGKTGGGEVFGFPPSGGLAEETSTKVVMDVYFTGYLLAAVNWFDYLCCLVLLVHILLAMGHTMWILISRPRWGGGQETSDAWDSIAEVIALSHCSEPPEEEVLGNTCAGIRRFGTMGRVAVVEVRVGAGGGGEELQLRYRGDARMKEREEDLKPVVGCEYGRGV